MATTFILGGTPRAGKSTLSKLLFNKYHINILSTDLLREGFMYGVPEFGILNDDASQSDEDKSRILWPYFKGLLKAREFFDEDLVIEGTNFEPQYLSEIKDRKDLKICFLGFSDVDVEKKAQQIRASEANDSNEWTSEMTDIELRELVVYLKERSNYFKKECEEYDMKYIDTSENFEDAINSAANFLLM